MMKSKENRLVTKLIKEITTIIHPKIISSVLFLLPVFLLGAPADGPKAFALLQKQGPTIDGKLEATEYPFSPSVSMEKWVTNPATGENDFLFTNRLRKPWSLPGIWGLYKKLCREAGLKSCYSPHSTRHTFGFMTFQRSKNIRLTQHLLGHSSVSTTQVYVHVDPVEVVETVNNLW